MPRAPRRRGRRGEALLPRGATREADCSTAPPLGTLTRPAGLSPARLACMTTPPGLAARALCAAADEALTEASFRTADFAEAERLFAEARDLAAGDGDRDGEALAVTGL